MSAEKVKIALQKFPTIVFEGLRFWQRARRHWVDEWETRGLTTRETMSSRPQRKWLV